MRKIIYSMFLMSMLLLSLLLSACSNDSHENKQQEAESTEAANTDEEQNDNLNEDRSSDSNEEQSNDAAEEATRSGDNTQIEITMENGDVIKAELYPDIAPITVENFLKLVNDEFYDGLIFHRVIPGFMIQGGCPLGTGMGDPGSKIKGEFASNGFENSLKHEKGVLSMARESGNMDSAGSQFFIMHEQADYLDGEYAAFGKVIDEASLQVVDKIASVECDMYDKPLEDQTIKSIRVVK